jgi:ABC-type lipoprotein export system ATPase subunit
VHGEGRVGDELAELHADGSTIVAVTHDPRFARRADHAVRLRDGRA